MKINWKYLMYSVMLSVGIGLFAALLTAGKMDVYPELAKPVLAPPSWLFPVVWSVLYVLMGISAYMIYVAEESRERSQALAIYGVQLIVNLCWSIVFFVFQQYLWAFVVLTVLWTLILLMVLRFAEIHKKASELQVPYLVWVTFAGYLNLMIYLLNRH